MTCVSRSSRLCQNSVFIAIRFPVCFQQVEQLVQGVSVPEDELVDPQGARILLAHDVIVREPDGSYSANAATHLLHDGYLAVWGDPFPRPPWIISPERVRLWLRGGAGAKTVPF